MNLEQTICQHPGCGVILPDTKDCDKEEAEACEEHGCPGWTGYYDCRILLAKGEKVCVEHRCSKLNCIEGQQGNLCGGTQPFCEDHCCSLYCPNENQGPGTRCLKHNGLTIFQTDDAW